MLIFMQMMPVVKKFRTTRGLRYLHIAGIKDERSLKRLERGLLRKGGRRSAGPPSFSSSENDHTFRFLFHNSRTESQEGPDTC